MRPLAQSSERIRAVERHCSIVSERCVEFPPKPSSLHANFRSRAILPKSFEHVNAAAVG